MAHQNVPEKLPKLPTFIDRGQALDEPVRKIWREQALGIVLAPPADARTLEVLQLQESRPERIVEALASLLGRNCYTSVGIPFGRANSRPDVGIHFDASQDDWATLICLNVEKEAIRARLARHNRRVPLNSDDVFVHWPDTYDPNVLQQLSQAKVTAGQSLLFPTSNPRGIKGPVGAWHDITSSGQNPEKRASHSFVIHMY